MGVGGELDGGAGLDLHENLAFHIAFIPVIPPPLHTHTSLFINNLEPGKFFGVITFLAKRFFSNDNQLLFDSLMSFNSHNYNGTELKRSGNQILRMAI